MMCSTLELVSSELGTPSWFDSSHDGLHKSVSDISIPTVNCRSSCRSSNPFSLVFTALRLLMFSQDMQSSYYKLTVASSSLLESSSVTGEDG